MANGHQPMAKMHQLRIVTSKAVGQCKNAQVEVKDNHDTHDTSECG